MSEMRPDLLSFLPEPLDAYGERPGGLLDVLRAIQEKLGYLPEAALDALSPPFSAGAVKATVRFFSEFRLAPAQGRRVGVCHGTACHTAGAPRVLAALEAKLPDTTEIVRTGCLGCCTLAPVVQLDERVVGHADATTIVGEVTGQPALRKTLVSGPWPARKVKRVAVRVGVGSCCQAKGADAVLAEVARWAETWSGEVEVSGVGCVAACSETPVLELSVNSGPWRPFLRVTPESVGELLAQAVPEGLSARTARALDEAIGRLHGRPPTPPPENVAVLAEFMAGQVRWATEGLGEVMPTDLSQALKRGAFRGVEWARENPEQALALVTESGLRGRGGAGFPTASKWAMARSKSGPKLVVANGDEGDPGAFMDRMLLESFPFRVIEGMAIAGAVTGAESGLLFVRAEYALACERCAEAIARCRTAGLLGKTFDVTLVRGASAYVCGEETALISVLENRGPFPRRRPPFPAESGFNGRPTVVNNVETLALLPKLMVEGAEAFRALGTDESPGTKVFALAGKVRRGGLIEVPLGTTIDAVVNGIGGGARPGRTIIAVQVGGPSGGCIPATAFDTPVTFETLREHGAIMGSGGLVVLDDTDCMVDLARYFVSFSAAQACGGCREGRDGVAELLVGLDTICSGRGDVATIDHLRVVSRQLVDGARCGLCRTAPNPFLSSLAAFPDAWSRHLDGICSQRRCPGLVDYVIQSNCTGCTHCRQVCPTSAIEGESLHQHAVVDERCIRCGACRDVCPFGAVDIMDRGGADSG